MVLARWWAALSLLLSVSGAVSAIGVERPVAVPRTGPAVIIIAPATPSADDQESETYGDYAEYLNGFAANRPAGLELVRLSPAQYKRLFRLPMIADSHATIMLRRTGTAMIYRGMILEPQVYQAGARWAAGGATPAVEIGLESTRLVRRR